MYETYELVKNFYDFRYILAAGQLYGEILRQLADNVIIPMDAADYADTVNGYWVSLRDGAIGEQMADYGIDFSELYSLDLFYARLHLRV